MAAGKMSARKRKHDREYKLLEELQRDHGYTLMEAGRGVERSQLMFDRATNKMSMACVMRLAVPSDSALGEAITKSRAQSQATEKPAARKRAAK